MMAHVRHAASMSSQWLEGVSHPCAMPPPGSTMPTLTATVAAMGKTMAAAALLAITRDRIMVAA